MWTRTDPRFTAYLENAPVFARPILEHIRGLVQDVCPTVQETLKWSQPAFVYRGKILCIVGAFKAHCRLHFWSAEIVLKAAQGVDKDGERVHRLTSVADLPDDKWMHRCLEAAMEFAESGEPAPTRERKPGKPKAELPVPADFVALLKKAPAAKKFLEGLPPGQRKEYLAWIGDAKREETRVRRMATAVEWLGEGKRYGWKYEKC